MTVKLEITEKPVFIAETVWIFLCKKNNFVVLFTFIFLIQVQYIWLYLCFLFI